jgi:nicotinamide-nucleotide amidase
MKAEIIYIGTELLLGQILNSNAVFLGRELSALGIDCYFQTIVGDNKDRIKESFRIALERANLIITTGGLGPTSDDLTTECWAELFDEKLILDEKVLENIKQIFARRNRVMAESNIKQAFRPASSDLLQNPIGTAPGIIWDLTKQCKKHNLGNGEYKLAMTFPGVPREMQAMWKETAQSFLARKLSGQNILVWKELKFYGIGESALAEQVQDLLNMKDPTVAPLAGKAECRLRLATKAPTEEIGLKRLKSTEEEIFKRVGKFVYGFNDDTLESVVAQKLKKQNLILALAESCTGGLLSQRLTDIPGSSAYTKTNIVAYANESKIQLLKINPALIERFGVVSEEVAIEMAEGIRELAKADIGLSITGIAGPDGGSKEKPIGTVYIAIAYKNLKKAKKFSFGQSIRSDNRWLASQEALNWLRQIL